VDPGDVEDVQIGGVRALELRVEEVDGESFLSVLVQGAPEPGPATIVLDAETLLLDSFDYLPPADPAFDRVVAFGASLTQGVQDAVPTFEGTLGSPALALARLMGAYLPQPQLVPGLFDTLDIDSVGPAPECEASSVVTHITAGMASTLPKLAREDGSGFGYEVGRLDPVVQVRNLAAGNYMLDDTVHGPTESEIVQIFLGHLAFDPFGTFGEPPSFTQLDAIEALEPTLIFSTDFLGNDALSGMAVESIEADLPILVTRLAATGAEVFLGDVPDITILPGRIGDPDPDTVGRIDEYNVALHREADRFDNVHVVPLAAATAELAADGISIGGESVGIRMFGGLLSFDGLHFSDTGYGLVAQVFADAISEELGIELPPIPLGSLFATDIHSPPAVRAAGRDPDACRPGS
jgi:lysophospholipase L1-like esterase